MAKTQSVADKSWESHMQVEHGLRPNKVGMLYRSVRHAHQQFDTTAHEPIYDLHDHIHYQGKLFLRGRRNLDGTPAMKPEMERNLSAAYNETRGRTYLEPVELAAVLHISLPAAYRIIDSKKIASYRPTGQGGPIRVDLRALQTYMEDNQYSTDAIADAVLHAQKVIKAQDSQTVKTSPTS